MNLAQGGHLTHGMKLNFSGRLYEVHAYGVRQDTERIDYDALAAQAEEVRPKMIVAGASAYPRIIDFERMAEIAHAVGALLFVDMAHIAGLVAAGVHPSPVPARRHRHDDDAQDAARAARRPDLQPPRPPRGHRSGRFPTVKTSLAATDRQDGVPGRPGRPAHARHRRQGGRVPARRSARSSGATSGGRSRTRRSSPRRSPAAGRVSCPAARTTTSCSSM